MRIECLRGREAVEGRQAQGLALGVAPATTRIVWVGGAHFRRTLAQSTGELEELPSSALEMERFIEAVCPVETESNSILYGCSCVRTRFQAV